MKAPFNSLQRDFNLSQLTNTIPEVTNLFTCYKLLSFRYKISKLFWNRRVIRVTLANIFDKYSLIAKDQMVKRKLGDVIAPFSTQESSLAVIV